MKRATVPALIAGLLACGAAAHADDVLDNLQDGIAQVAAKARAAVVTIEDSRLAEGSVKINSGLAASLKALSPSIRKSIADALSGLGTDGIPKVGAGSSLDKGIEDAESRLENDEREQEAHIERVRRQLREAERAGEKETAAELERQLSGLRAALESMRQTRRTLRQTLQLALKSVPQAVVITPQMPKVGTGFSIGDDYFVTTADVLEDMHAPVVVTSDGTRARATVIGIDPVLNVGVVKLNGKLGLPGLPFGDARAIRIGNFAVTVGNQAGEADSAALMFVGNVKTHGTTAGPRYYPSLIQVDGTIGAGTSGAPLLDTRGQVIGIIVAALHSDYDRLILNERAHSMHDAPAIGPPMHGGVEEPGETGAVASSEAPGAFSFVSSNAQTSVQALPRMPAAAWGVFRPAITSAGLAVPAYIVRADIAAWRAGRQVRHAYLGAEIDSKETFNDDGNIMRVVDTAVVVNVVPGTAAAAGGLMADDVLVRINGVAVHNVDEIKSVLLTLEPDQAVPVEVLRGGQPRTLSVKLGSAPGAVSQPH